MQPRKAEREVLVVLLLGLITDADDYTREGEGRYRPFDKAIPW